MLWKISQTEHCEAIHPDTTLHEGVRSKTVPNFPDPNIAAYLPGMSKVEFFVLGIEKINIGLFYL